MAKENKNSNPKKETLKAKKTLIPEKYQNAVAAVLISLLLIIFFRDAIFNGSFWGAADTIGFQGFKNYLEQSEEYPLWQPYIFGGMPGMAARMEAATRYWDVIVTSVQYTALFAKKIFDSDTMKNLTWYIILAVGMYFMMRQYNKDRLISFFVAVAFIFGTGIAIWVMIGHNAKTPTFAVVPFIFLMIERIKERASLLNITLMVIFMHIMLAGGHYQLIFYVACAVIIYMLFDLITQIIKKGNWLGITKVIGSLLIATLFAFLLSADKQLSVTEYVPYSTRGLAPISERVAAQETGQSTASKRTDEDYEYATMWSFSPDEIIDLFVPSYHGFGKITYSGPLTGNREAKIMTYWGQKPFEDATPYMGATVMFLALLGMIRYFKKNTLVQAMTVTTFFALLLSFGNTFPILYDFFFYYVPMFSSFRAPSMALVLMHLTMPILAAFGLQTICEMSKRFGTIKQLPKEEKTPLFIFFSAIGFFILSGLIFATAFEDSYMNQVANAQAFQGYNEQVLGILVPFIWDMLISDWTIIGFLCIVLAGLTYAFINKKMPQSVFLLSVILLVIIDLWRISYRPMELVDPQTEKQPFPQTDIVNFILRERQETGERFRVCDMTLPVVNSHAYFFIENTNGYFPAKLRTFQDMMDMMCGGSTSTVTHPFMWNLLNAKYIITGQRLGGSIEPIFQSQQTGAFVYFNPSYCKRVFFVDSIRVADDFKILNNLNESNFNPKTLAYIEKPLGREIVPSGQYDAEMRDYARLIRQNNDSAVIADESVDINKNVFVPTANIIEYKNEYIKIETETQEQHLLVLSEMYYPVSWKAYINDVEAEIFKTNFAFRSVVVPAGRNIVEFKFVSERFILGKNISIASNIVVILALILGIFFEKKRKNPPQVQQPQPPIV